MSAIARGPSRPAGATGAYLLLLSIGEDRELGIGKLGRTRFRRGNYVYIGSGMGGLEKRVARHFRTDKKVKWHIDRLLAVAKLGGAVLFPSKARKECELARSCLSMPGAVAVRGFGSSDCRCPGHLAYLGTLPFGALLGRLNGREPLAVSREPGTRGSLSPPSHGSRPTAHGSRKPEASH